jgi:hypothetical protein
MRARRGTNTSASGGCCAALNRGSEILANGCAVSKARLVEDGGGLNAVELRVDRVRPIEGGIGHVLHADIAGRNAFDDVDCVQQIQRIAGVSYGPACRSAADFARLET